MNDFCLHKSTLGQFTKQLFDLISTGKRYRIKISEWRDKRSIPQNSLMWMWNADIVDAINETGLTKTSPDEIHEFLKDMFCPAKEIEILGLKKTVKSTRLLDVEEMSFYLRRVEVWSVEKGLKLRIPNNSEYHQSRQNYE